MKKKFAVLLLVLMCLLLAGCAFRKEALDPQMRAVVQALNDDDEQAFRALWLMQDFDEQTLHTLYAHLHAGWTQTDPDTAKLVNYSVSITNGQKVGEGQYVFENGCSLSIRYYDGDYGKGITNIGVSHNASYSTAWELFGPQMLVFLLSSLVNAAFIVFTIVDISRRRPPKHGWYVVMALVTLPIPVPGYLAAFPAGAIVWWCIRRSVLQKSADAQESVSLQHTYTDTSRDPWEQ